MREALAADKLTEVYDRVSRRYDFQHSLLTLRSDQRARKLVVDVAVRKGDKVLDCGSGTGSTALLAAQKVGSTGNVLLFDLSEGMLSIAKKKAASSGLLARMRFQVGDVLQLPFADDTFDSVLSTYSMCPLYEPADAALELYRVLKHGGRLGVAHSSTPQNRLLRILANQVENLVWLFPSLSLGCRPISILPALQSAGARTVLSRRLGVPLWPFHVFVIEKPA